MCRKIKIKTFIYLLSLDFTYIPNKLNLGSCKKKIIFFILRYFVYRRHTLTLIHFYQKPRIKFKDTNICHNLYLEKNVYRIS